MSVTGLPPEMTKADLKAFLMNPPDPLTREERDAWEPVCDALVDGIFLQRASPRVILTPIALNLARIAVEQIDNALIGHIYAGGSQ